ncbi:hypothetical protein K493DRAFT_351780 [Basidiobolus meristosporus CBS 931.73]|uniref:Uncharacterized protein n=1 Tax=Basidiobolus meristosporus CBS 931.73 TaxID=1314790 RepID=A0A1Y1YB67_9FUNG|nr:hypothetical protein K493DRAFT_351780 [Basidiobolus meristosporus CBS 931.73]|eukprot:ORX95249.1 hypothetical protein K493DRAFT_351780 [Basidiobolus meristosporus CBS 931.73]
MRGKLKDRYLGIKTKRGSCLYHSSPHAPKEDQESIIDKDCGEKSSTITSSGSGTFGSPEYLEKTRKKLADDSVVLRRKQTNAIEQFRNELQLNSSLPHYKVLQVAYFDYKRMKENQAETDKLRVKVEYKESEEGDKDTEEDAEPGAEEEEGKEVAKSKRSVKEVLQQMWMMLSKLL